MSATIIVYQGGELDGCMRIFGLANAVDMDPRYRAFVTIAPVAMGESTIIVARPL